MSRFPSFAKVKKYAKDIAYRYPGFKHYARNLLDSLRKLKTVLFAIVSDTVRFFRNLVRIVILTILRGLNLLFINIFDIFKAIFRAIIDVFRWPLEHIIYPIIHWLADTAENIATAVQVRDEVALGLFFGLIIFCIFFSWFAAQILGA